MHGFPGFSGELGNYCIRLCVVRLSIIGSLESSYVMVVSSGREVTFNQAVLDALGKVGKPGMVLKDEQTLATHRLSSLYHPRRLGGSSSSPWIVNNPLAYLASISERQKRHSKVVRCQLCSTHVPVVYLPNISLCYCLQAQLTCHNKFYRKNDGILHTRANNVYQALPLIFRAPGNEAIVLTLSLLVTHAEIHVPQIAVRG